MLAIKALLSVICCCFSGLCQYGRWSLLGLLTTEFCFKNKPLTREKQKEKDLLCREWTGVKKHGLNCTEVSYQDLKPLNIFRYDIAFSQFSAAYVPFKWGKSSWILACFPVHSSSHTPENQGQCSLSSVAAKLRSTDGLSDTHIKDLQWELHLEKRNKRLFKSCSWTSSVQSSPFFFGFLFA